VRTARALSWTLLVAGLATLVYAGLRGDLDVYLLAVIPVVAGTGPWAAVGLLAAIVGLAGLAWTSATQRLAAGTPPDGSRPGGEQAGGRTGDDEAMETKSGGVILLGPIPIAWGSDRPTSLALILAAIVLTGAAIGLTLVLRSG
jgi:uncharacterized protein (TIGR00304 family)